MKRERIYLLVAVDIYYDPTRPGERRHQIASAREDVLVCNTLPNEAKWSRVTRRPKRRI